MTTARLALPIDVARKVDPQVTVKDLGIDTSTASQGDEERMLIGSQDDLETIRSRIEGVEYKLAAEHGGYYKLYYAGQPGDKNTWETPDDIVNRTRHFAFPHYFVNLPHSGILPYDETKGDQFQVRNGTGENDWETLSSDDFTLDNEAGTLRVNKYRWLNKYYDHPGNSFRATYRFGARGGNFDDAGQTGLVNDTNTVLIDGTSTGDQDLVDAHRLPRGNHVFQIGGEYIRGEVDAANGLISVNERGVRGTSASAHASGDTIHYCPINVREAVAAKTAIELEMYSDVIDSIAGERINPSDKIERWQQEWQELVSSSAGWKSI